MFQANVATGETCASAVDLSLPGFIPFEIERKYRSLSNFDGLLGWNWNTPLDQGLRIHDGAFTFRDASGGETPIAAAKGGEPRLLAVDGGLKLFLEEREFVLHSGPLRIFYRNPRATADPTSFLRPHKVVDQHGNTLSFLMNRAGLPEGLVDTSGRRVQLRYNAHGKVVEIRLHADPGGERVLVRYEYDDSGNLTTVAAPAGTYRFEYVDHLVVQWTHPSGSSGYATYDRHRRCTSLWHDGGVRLRQIDYDDHRRVTRITDSSGHRTVYRRNEAGLVTETINPLGGVETNVYSADGGLLATLNALGRPTPLAVADAEVRTIAVSDAAGATTVFRENEHGHPLMMVDACGNTRRWQYDASGDLIGLETPSGARSALRYDARGFLCEIRDISGRTLTQARSDDGRSLAVRDEVGPIVEYRYDEMGDLVAAIDGTGAARRVKRDEAGRIVQSESPDGGTVKYEYDAAGNLALVIDEIGRQTRLDYDPFGKCVRVHWPGGHAVRYEYDPEDNPTAILNEKGEAHRFTYDAMGRVVRQRFFDGSEESYSYDLAGRLAGVVDAGGGTTTLLRDEVGNLMEKRLRDGTIEAFSYDPLRRLTRAENPAAVVEFERDPDGNLVRELQDTHVLRFAYLPGGRRQSLKASWGREIGYEYDTRGRLTTIRDSATGTHSFEYDHANRPVALHYPNGAVLRTRHDARGRTAEQTLCLGSRHLLTVTYEFDAADRLIGATEIGGASCRMEYDAGDCLLAVKGAGQSERYEYDATGNLLASSPAGRFAYDPGDRLIAGPGFGRQYDANGAVIRESQAGLERTFEYDGADRLRRILVGGRTVAEYDYDVLGRRTRKTAGGVETRFLWDGFALLGESIAGQRTDYLVLPSTFLPMSRRVGDRVQHFITDRRGCVIAIMDGDGSLAARFDYTAFGALRNSTGGTAHPFRLRGQYFDPETGFHYNLHRYYDPQAGRFLTRDPIGLQGGRNAYRFGSNPITWEDPFGLSGECQGDVFYRAMSTKEKEKVMKDCQLHAREGKKCPEGPYVTQARAYCESAMAEKPDEYEHLVEICTKPGTASRLSSSPFACRNGSQALYFPSLPDVVSGNPNRIEHKMERVGRPDQGLNYGLSKGKGLEQFNSEVESMKVVGTGETCVP